MKTIKVTFNTSPNKTTKVFEADRISFGNSNVTLYNESENGEREDIVALISNVNLLYIEVTDEEVDNSTS